MLTDSIARLRLLDWPEDTSAPVLDELRPAGLGEHEILLIRDLDVVADPADFHAALRSEMGECLRVAQRPVRGRIRPDAAVLLFRDEAEYLAAFLVAHVNDVVQSQWWWTHLGLAGSPTSVLLGANVPVAAVLALAIEHEAPVAVTSLFAEGETMALVRTICRQHELDIDIAIPDTSPDPLTTDQRPQDRDGGEAPVAVRRGQVVLFSCARNRQAMAQLLVELASFVVGRWQSSPAQQPATEVPAQHSDATEVMAQTPTEPESPAAPDTKVEAQKTAIDDTTQSDESSVPPNLGAAAPSAPPGDSAQARPVGPSTAEVVTGDERTGQPALVPAAALADGALPHIVATKYAGLFYLINPILDVDLTDIAEPGDAPWALVEAVARAVLATQKPDAIWDVFGGLANRQPGEQLDPTIVEAGRRVTLALETSLDIGRRELAALVSLSGELELSANAITVYLPLDAIKIEVRRRGMDVDPGWVPSLGRIIRFMFGEAAR